MKSEAGARLFAEGLYELLHSEDELETRFTNRCGVVAKLPRKQTRVLTWPLVTVFGFIAQPRIHFFLKPKVTRVAAQEYGYEWECQSRPNWKIYAGLLDFAVVVRRDLRDLRDPRPRDMIDIQSFPVGAGLGRVSRLKIARSDVHKKANCFRRALFLMPAADAFKGVQDQVGNFGLNTLVQV